MSQEKKLKGYDFYNHLNNPKYMVAPMVDQSELAWRILSRRYGAQLCYTPMFNARLFSTSDKYRKEMFKSTQENSIVDSPLIVQFAANDPKDFLNAAKMVEKDCVAVDLNLGCPQHIAKRGHYGSFLQDEWDLIREMVSTLDRELCIPVTCKIRIFEDVNKTIAYAKMLQDAGCSILTVHGRTRDQKGHNTGLADWDQIKKVKEALTIPVFANGNILYYEDVQACLEYTKADGVMTAEGNLYNPCIFSPQLYPSWKIAAEYLEICREYPNSANISMIRGHLFKLFHACLAQHVDLRSQLVVMKDVNDAMSIVLELKQRVCTDESALDVFDVSNVDVDEKGIKILPNWVLQPYIRKPMPVSEDASTLETVKEGFEKKSNDHNQENQPDLVNLQRSVKRKRKEEGRQAKIASRKSQLETKFCGLCFNNVKSDKCSSKLCKQCCKTRPLDVELHLIADLFDKEFICIHHHSKQVPECIITREGPSNQPVEALSITHQAVDEALCLNE